MLRGACGGEGTRPLSTLHSPGDGQRAAESILRQTLNATMVVLATRGEHAARLLGAVSQYVLRHAPCPVLVVPEASKGL